MELTKPDNIWCFSKDKELFESAGACKINTADLGFVLVLEVLEHGVQQHSDARSISDADREKQIRKVFGMVSVCFVYVVVAHTKHAGAGLDDVFFVKDLRW